MSESGTSSLLSKGSTCHRSRRKGSLEAADDSMSLPSVYSKRTWSPPCLLGRLGGVGWQAQHGWETLPTVAEIQDNYGGLNRARQSKLGMRAVKGAVSDTWQPGTT